MSINIKVKESGTGQVVKERAEMYSEKDRIAISEIAIDLIAGTGTTNHDSALIDAADIFDNMQKFIKEKFS